MTDREIIIKLLDGCSLRTRMVPNPAIPSNNPEHVETYNLPHVIIKGDLFWGKSKTAHIVIDTETLEISKPTCFCYTNSTDWFLSHSPSHHRAKMMKKCRYREHDWVLKKNYRLIWDSQGGQPAEAVRDEIDAAAKFRIAMLDSEGIWNIHPVDLPMYYPDSGTFEMKTVHEWYIITFRYPEEFSQYLETRDLQISEPKDLLGIWNFDTSNFSTFYDLRSDGTYQNYYDLPRRTRQEYKALKIFSDNI